MQKQNKVLSICIMALSAALSIVLGKVFSFTFLTLRISFESLPVIICSFCLGPFAGALTGFMADVLGCFIVGYTINPVITLGCVLMGVLPPIFKSWIKGKKGYFISVLLSHIICSMTIKTIGLLYVYGGGATAVFLRVLTYILISVVEGYLVSLLMPSIKRGED